MACASFSFSASFFLKKDRQDEKLDYGDVEGCLREWKTKKA